MLHANITKYADTVNIMMAVVIIIVMMMMAATITSLDDSSYHANNDVHNIRDY